MPRNLLGAMRNRNRVTNKTRLRIHQGNIEAECLDTDDIITSNLNTAGVDAEDANEHHLQAVLSAASQRHQAHAQRSTRGAAEKVIDAPAAYIPTPDSTGLVDNYEEFYPAGRWIDPETYIRSSETVDDACANALANNFTYFMDERDKDWLDKNNEEARGEGTSAQGAVSSGTTTRSAGSQRSAKAKGKEPEVVQPLVISEDEFELVMGVFEKSTHEKTEFLHHGLEQGMAFPPFSDYQDTFSSPLSPATFATYIVPTWIPPPSQLHRIARVIYPYWRERRTERGGHRIIPTLNYDEADTNNESYVCFRRRDIKAVRKTRASQAMSSEKLLRLQNELQATLELAQSVIAREKLKKEASQQSLMVWERRLGFVELKRKFPTLAGKEDEELLHDKERVPKKPKTESSASSRLPGLRLRTRESGDLGSPIMHADPQIRPKDRLAAIQSAMEREMQRQKERDHHWDDQVDNLYQPFPVPFASRHFKWIPPTGAPSLSVSLFADEDQDTIEPRAVRIRKGRFGRTWIDRRHASTPSIHDLSRGLLLRRQLSSSETTEESEPDREERNWRIAERWKFDADDEPPVGPEGPDEQDRVLIDDYDPQYLRHTMTLLHEQDHVSLVTDPTILVSTPDGRQQAVTMIRQQPIARGPGPPRPGPLSSQPSSSHSNGIALSLPLQNGTPISVMKKMQPPPGLPQMRISSNGGMRPPSTPLVGSMQNMPPPHSSPPQVPASQPANGVNGHASNDTTEKDVKSAIPNGTVSTQSDANGMSPGGSVPGPGSSPVRPKSQDQHHPISIPNGFHPAGINGFPTLQNGLPYIHANAQHNGLSAQQMQTIKSAFAGMPPGTDLNAMLTNGGGRGIPSYMGHIVANGGNFNMQVGAGGNMNMKLPNTRQMQWPSVGSPLQRPISVGNVDSSAMNSSVSPSPNLGHVVPPARTPSANGSRRGSSVVGPGSAGQLGSHSMSMSPHLQHSPSPMQAHSSPPRPMPSPSLQHQTVGQGGY